MLDHLEGPRRASRRAGSRAAATEFVLEGLWAQKKIGHSDDRGFVAPGAGGESELDLERLERLRKLKKQVSHVAFVPACKYIGSSGRTSTSRTSSTSSPTI
ncbi:MAG: hypothetical protein U0599_14745 [Vicinamibacteria bacterium]